MRYVSCPSPLPPMQLQASKNCSVRGTFSRDKNGNHTSVVNYCTCAEVSCQLYALLNVGVKSATSRGRGRQKMCTRCCHLSGDVLLLTRHCIFDLFYFTLANLFSLLHNAMSSKLLSLLNFTGLLFYDPSIIIIYLRMQSKMA